MNFRKSLLILGLAASAAGLANCTISKPECTVGQTSTPQIGLNFAGLSAFAVRYVLVEGTGECANFKGEVVGFQSYHPDAGDKTRDFTKTKVAVRTQSLGELAWLTEDFGLAGDVVEPNAIGEFSDILPDGDDMCHGTNFTAAQVIFPGGVFPSDPANYPLVDDMLPAECMADADCNTNFNYVCAGADPAAGTPGACALPASCTADADCNGVQDGACLIDQGATEGVCVVAVNIPAADLKYEWSNVSFYVTAAATGTQFSADVAITLNGCTAKYKAVGMWPAIPCDEFPYADPEFAASFCAVDKDCEDPAYPKCSADYGICIHECQSDADCSATNGNPKCDTAVGFCVNCLADSDCSKADFKTCAGDSCSHIVTGAELCNPESDVAHGRASGSGINPDFGPTECKTDMTVLPVVDQFYNLPDIGGLHAPTTESRCVLSKDDIPQLNGYSAPTSTQ